MESLDYDYLEKLIKKVKKEDSDAFAELFTATYREQYRHICHYTRDPYTAHDLLESVYATALNRIDSLESSKSLNTWLTRINMELCRDSGFKPLNLESGSDISITAETANQLLNSILFSTGMKANAVPVEVLEAWGNYRKPQFRNMRRTASAFIVFVLLLPFLFFKPKIIAERTNVNSNANADYSVTIKTIVPVKSVSATLNNTPVPMKQQGAEYKCTIQDNGTLEIKAISLNGQTTTRKYTVSHLDIEKPEFVESYSQNSRIYVKVKDTFSGIDYEKITGLDLESYDENTGVLEFKVPKEPTTVIVPDKAGNELQLLVSPVN